MKQKKTKFCLATLVLIACLVGVFMMTSAHAKTSEATKIFTVGNLSVSDAEVFDSIGAAFDAAASRTWASDDVLEIRFKGEISPGPQNGLMFNQTTIWRQDGTKLPIIIRGVDTAKARDAYIYVDAAGGWYACANDYTFVNLTLPISSHNTEFFAGSGNITFENVSFTNSSTATIANETDRERMYEISRDTAISLCNSLNLDRIPYGDACYALYSDEAIGDTLYGKNGNTYGDYIHDGDTGGGQYLNACVWYEVLTHRSCVGNTWRPAYALEEAKIPHLQAAAHDAVTAVYGADYYSTVPTDIGGDGVLNVLILGSSNAYYFGDELVMIAKEDGVNLRVVHAYYSGVPISDQWSFISGDLARYEVNVYENDGSHKVTASQKISSILPLYTWDVVDVFQSSTVFAKYNFYADDVNATALADCAHASDIFAYLRARVPNARYTWFQTSAMPLGAPGPSLGNGKIFADNCTQAVFSGWPELAPGEKVHTSVTFGDNIEFVAASKYFIGAVGYISSAPATAYTASTAGNVTYLEAPSYDNIPDIRPVNLEATIIVDGAPADLGAVCAKIGYAPTDAKVQLKSGTAYYLYGDTASSTAHSLYGNITLEMSGGVLRQSIYATKDCNLTGNLTVNVSGGHIEGNIRGAFSSGKVTGNTTIVVSGGEIDGAFYGGFADGTVTNEISGGIIHGAFYSLRSVTAGHLINRFTGGELYGTVYAGHFESSHVIGGIENTVSGNVKFHAPVWLGGYRSTTGNITNTVSGGEFYDTLNVTGTAGTASSTVTTAITDGIFHGNVEAGRGTLVKVTAVRTTVSGGTFYGTLSAAHASDQLILSTGTINLGSSAQIRPTSVSGNVTLRQIEAWESNTVYFHMDATNVDGITTATAGGVGGSVQKVESDHDTEFVGRGAALPIGARLVIDDMIRVKVYFDAANLSFASDDWAYTLTSDIAGFSDVTGGKADFTEEGQYSVLTLPAVGASNFHVPFVLTVPGADPLEISVMSLCETGINTTYAGKTAELVSLLKGIYNLGLAAHERFHDDVFDGTYKALTYSGKYNDNAIDYSGYVSEDGTIGFTGASLSLGAASGIDLYVKSSHSVSVYVNGEKISSSYYRTELIPAEQQASFGGATRILHLSIKAKAFDTPFSIEIHRGDQSATLNNVTIAAVANMNQASAEQNLVQRFLAYVEAVSDYINQNYFTPVQEGDASDFTGF